MSVVGQRRIGCERRRKPTRGPVIRMFDVDGLAGRPHSRVGIEIEHGLDPRRGSMKSMELSRMNKRLPGTAPRRRRCPRTPYQTGRSNVPAMRRSAVPSMRAVARLDERHAAATSPRCRARRAGSPSSATARQVGAANRHRCPSRPPPDRTGRRRTAPRQTSCAARRRCRSAAAPSAVPTSGRSMSTVELKPGGVAQAHRPADGPEVVLGERDSPRAGSSRRTRRRRPRRGRSRRSRFTPGVPSNTMRPLTPRGRGRGERPQTAVGHVALPGEARRVEGADEAGIQGRGSRRGDAGKEQLQNRQARVARGRQVPHAAADVGATRELEIRVRACAASTAPIRSAFRRTSAAPGRRFSGRSRTSSCVASSISSPPQRSCGLQSGPATSSEPLDDERACTATGRREELAGTDRASFP